MLKHFNSLIEFQKAFSTELRCINYIIELRWGGMLTCPRCGCAKASKYASKVGLFWCKGCKKPFTIRIGTIFEDSPLPLTKWFLAFYLETSNPKGISSCQLAKHLDIHQESAWAVLQRIRWAISHQTIEKMKGDVGADETFVGGKEKNKHANKKKPRSPLGGESKIVVFGVVSRLGKLAMQKINKLNIANIKPLLEEYVDLDNAILHTDESPLYKGYNRKVVNHSKGEYSRNGSTTNLIECAFSHLKRRIIGVHHQISEKHVDKYISVSAFAFNHGGYSVGEKFSASLSLAFGRKLTYVDLMT